MSFSLYSGNNGCSWLLFDGLNIVACENVGCKYAWDSKPICSNCISLLKKMLQSCGGI